MARAGKTGDIVQISFDQERHVYGRLLVEPYLAVYDYPTGDDVADMAEVVARPILFIVAVHHRATNGRTWPVVGTVPGGSPPIAVPDFFMQDAVNPARCKIIDVNGVMRQVSPQECVGLERAAVWDAEYVVQRIQDHYAGRPNAHLEAMRLK